MNTQYQYQIPPFHPTIPTPISPSFTPSIISPSLFPPFTKFSSPYLFSSILFPPSSSALVPLSSCLTSNYFSLLTLLPSFFFHSTL